jgi:hypothetical protein
VRALVGRRATSQPRAETRLARRRSELISRNEDRIVRIAISDAASCALLHEDGARNHHVVAVAHSGDGWSRPRLIVMAISPRWLVRVTPDSAQQGRVGPRQRRQDDRQDSRSKHVMLAGPAKTAPAFRRIYTPRIRRFRRFLR